ncbi:MAG: MFS transporter [Candidatus Krumholzibacteriota bacterium]|nr:MFS transporter [Candidatus Krumholzibacteriota bacterium]
MDRARGILRRLTAAAFFMNAGTFLVLAAIPYKVLGLGGGPVWLGLVPAVSSAIYVVVSQLAGRWSDRVGRYRLTRYGSLAFVAFASLAFAAPDLPRFLLVMPLLGLGMALFWPVMQAAVGDLSTSRRRLAANIGGFNVSWSLGKSLGYFAGGLALARYDFRSTFLAGIGLVALAFLAQPREEDAPGDRGEAVTPAGTGTESAPEAAAAAMAEVAAPPTVGATAGDEPEVPEATRRVFRRMGWVANLAAYGTGAVLNHQMPAWFEHAGWGEDRFGLFLGVVFLAQTATFLLLSGPVRFAYSARRLIAPQLVAAAVLLLMPLAPGWGLVLLAAPMLGVSFGVCYAASIFASLHTASRRGRNAGIHESLLGLGILLMPLLGGLGARATGWLGAPYALAGVVTLAAVGGQLAWRAAAAPARAPEGRGRRGAQSS